MAFTEPIFIVGTPDGLDIIKNIPHKLALYHCSDDFCEQGGFPRKFPVIERQLIEYVDLVIATSRTLAEKKLQFNKATYWFSNGVDYQHFSKAQLQETSIPVQMQKIPKPIIGYIGAIAEWFDQELIKQIAKLKPSWQIVIIGPALTNVSTLQDIANVWLLGKKDYRELPGYLKAFDVAIIPFVRNELTKNASPIKFYEYLASGKPIVSTEMADLKKFNLLSHLVTTRQEFVESIEQALQENTSELIQRRMEEAKRHSWESRFQQIEALIEIKLAEK